MYFHCSFLYASNFPFTFILTLALPGFQALLLACSLSLRMCLPVFCVLPIWSQALATLKIIFLAVQCSGLSGIQKSCLAAGKCCCCNATSTCPLMCTLLTTSLFFY